MADGFVLCDEDRGALEGIARSGCGPLRRVRPATALLLLADGGSVRGAARELGAHQDTVRRWRDRFAESGVGGLGAVAAGRGRRPSVPSETVEAIVADTLSVEPPDRAVCWSTRQMAARHGVGKDFVAGVWRERGLRPWLTDVCSRSPVTPISRRSSRT